VVAAGEPDTGPALDLTALHARRRGGDWVTRRVASNGVVFVAWQQVSVGKHRHGELVDVHVRPVRTSSPVAGFYSRMSFSLVLARMGRSSRTADGRVVTAGGLGCVREGGDDTVGRG
jgi:hypothetical protein